MTERNRPRILVIEHDDDVNLDLLARPLSGADLELVRLHAGDRVPALDGYAGLVVLGGAANAYDDEGTPELPRVRGLLMAAVERGVPALGVCLGAQLLAVAGGGTVQVDAPAGLEAGVVELRLRPGADDDPVLGPLVTAQGKTVVVPSMHFDAVTELPEGAQWLAASRQYPYQAFRLGSALGLQFHPEASARMLAGWARKRGLDAAQIEAEWNASAGQLHEAVEVIGGAFLAQVRAHAEAGDQVGAGAEAGAGAPAQPGAHGLTAAGAQPLGRV